VIAESGLLAVTVMGIYLGNRKGVPIEEVLEFKESLSLVLISGLFILLAARLDLGELAALGWAVVGVFLAIQLIARPLSVLYATPGSALNWRERLLLAWIAPRGIVAAAVSALFALKLGQRGFAQAELLVPLTFVVIIGTVVLQSLSARVLARALDATEPEGIGFLILGANPLARLLAQALVEQKIPVLLCDTLWDNVSRARMAGLKAYYGSPLSEHAEVYLDTTGLGRLLAITADSHLNALACSRFKGMFGPTEVFALRVGGPSTGNGRKETAREGPTVFGEETTYVGLAQRIHRGAEIRRTNLTDAFTLDSFRAMHGDRATPLFAPRPQGAALRLHHRDAAGTWYRLVGPGPDRPFPRRGGTGGLIPRPGRYDGSKPGPSTWCGRCGSSPASSPTTFGPPHRRIAIGRSVTTDGRLVTPFGNPVCSLTWGGIPAPATMCRIPLRQLLP
jgi:hypothetical protein